MANIQYQRNVPWDADLVDLGYDSAGYVINGSKITSGAPATVANRFQRGCMIQNTATGVIYKNTAAPTSSASWAIMDSNTDGLPPLTAASLWVGNGSNVATAVAPSGAVSMTNAGVFSIVNGAVTGAKLSTGKGYFTVAVDTNSTTPVNVFGAGGAPVALTVKSVKVISKDTTAGNIILKQAANTVATIAKGTDAGAVIGAVSLANTSYTAADVCTVESSSAGEATVEIVFEVA